MSVAMSMPLLAAHIAVRRWPPTSVRLDGGRLLRQGADRVQYLQRERTKASEQRL
jgi:hypothetical protein